MALSGALCDSGVEHLFIIYLLPPSSGPMGQIRRRLGGLGVIRRFLPLLGTIKPLFGPGRICEGFLVPFSVARARDRFFG